MNTNPRLWISARRGAPWRTARALAACVLVAGALCTGCRTTDDSIPPDREGGAWVDENGNELRPGDLDRNEYLDRNRRTLRGDRQEHTW